MKKPMVVFCLSAVLFLSVGWTQAGAGTRTLYPHQFTLATWSMPLEIMAGFVRRNFYWLGSVDGGGVAYESEIRLPVGATITKVAVHAAAEAGQPVEVWVGRAKLGDAEQTVTTFLASGERGWHETSSIDFARVAPGYRYWVHVDVSGSRAFVYGVKVSYR